MDLPAFVDKLTLSICFSTNAHKKGPYGVVVLPLKRFSLFIKKETQTFVSKGIILMKLRTYILAACFFGIAHLGQAQTPVLPNTIDASLSDLQTFISNKAFVSSYQLAKELKRTTIYNNNTSVKERVDFYLLVSGLQLNEKGIVEQASDFIKAAVDPAFRQIMTYYVGVYYFRNNQPVQSLTVLETAKLANLTNAQIGEVKYILGYLYFSLGQFEKAKQPLDAVRQTVGDLYYVDANYYYGFIAFKEKNYTVALQCFEIAKSAAVYGKLIPFYNAQIFYFTGSSEKALSTALAALQAGSQYYEKPLQQLVGRLLFAKNDFTGALPYLEKYVASTKTPSHEDVYELSFCYFEQKKWNKAIEGFKRLTTGKDSLSQNSMYLLAKAYLEIGDKSNARNAFIFCAENNSNKLQKEVAIFSVAKLSFEEGLTNEALKGFQEFLKQYPRSNYTQEATDLLVNTLARTSNFKEGLQLYAGIKNPSALAQKAYPSLLYGRAVELINDQYTNAADSLLDLLLAAPNNQDQAVLANFWKSEMQFRKGQYSEGITYLQKYLSAPVVNAEVNLSNAYYNLGFAQMQLQQYADAIISFEKATSAVKTAAPIFQDLVIKKADCFFMLKDFSKALTLYDQVIDRKYDADDYAYFQKSIILGASNKISEKLALLQKFVKQYPGSALIGDVYMEIANTYLASESFALAVSPLQQITSVVSLAAWHPAAYLKLGVAYFNIDKNDEALASFTSLLAKFPNTEESESSIEYIRNIFVENQKPQDFIAFMEANGKALTETEADSLTYQAALFRYEQKDFAGTKNGISAYIDKFPNGAHILEAHFMMASIYESEKNTVSAIKYLTYLASKAPNKYATDATLQLARAYYFELHDYAKATTYYKQLADMATDEAIKKEAVRGLIRSATKQSNWTDALPAATHILEMSGAASDDKMMAHFVLAKSKQLAASLDTAVLYYKEVIASGKSEFSAEAKYQHAKILFDQNKLEDSEKVAFEQIKDFGSYEYWVTKSYLLLGDIYHKQLDFFNAEATFQSIITNATFEDLKKEAKEKLAQVTADKAKK
jgi:tetratricopeptide (TPR) repeat protein